MNKKYEHMEKSLNLPSSGDIEDSYNDDDDDYEYEQDEIPDIEEFSNLSVEELEEKLKMLQEKMKDFDSFSELNNEITKKYNSDVDGIYNKALDDYTQIMSAALTMEPAHGSKFLAGAAKLLEIALRSKNSSMDKQLDMAKLQLDREKFIDTSRTKRNHRVVNNEDNSENYTEGLESHGEGENGGQIFDRNSLVEQLKERNKVNNKKDDNGE